MKKLYLNKSSKILSCILISLLIVFFICNLISYFNSSFALFFVKYIKNIVEGFLFYICSFIPNLSLHINFILIIGIIMSIILIMIGYQKMKNEKEITKNTYNLGAKLLLTFLFSLFLVECPFYIDNHVPSFDELLFIEQKDITYSEQDLIELNNYLANKIDLYINNFERENGKIKFDGDYVQLSINNINNIKADIPLLSGLYPAKTSKLSYNFKKYGGSTMMGNTQPYTVYVDDKMDVTEIISTTMHEFAHVKNVYRENEAEYTSFLAGIKSNDKLSNYSSYLRAFTDVNNVLWELNPRVADEIEDTIISKCLYGYNEVCGFYSKNVDEYFDNAKTMIISTYKLKNYKNYKEDLKKSLLIFQNNNIDFVINDEIVSIEDIMNLIDEESNYGLNLEFELNREIFNKIKPALSNPNLFLGISQSNSESKESELKKDLSNFYLAFIPTTKALFSNKSLKEDYTYGRVTRLILNYYKANGYN